MTHTDELMSDETCGIRGLLVQLYERDGTRKLAKIRS